jgi:hypothetical protein
MDQDEMNQKAQFERAYDAQRGEAQTQCLNPVPMPNCAQAVGLGRRPYTLREEAEKSAAHHGEQAQKHASAASFLAAHPEFDEFVRLVRAGAIQF